MMVAIEMITYNHGPYIRQAIESVMAQKTTFPYCLYIFEDCSTDNTAAICRELAAKYPDKIRLHLNPANIGIIPNAKLMHATTYASEAKYIAMCDGDDYWVDSNKLQKQVQFLEANDRFALCYHNIWFHADGRFILKNHIGKDKRQDIFSLTNGNTINTVSAVIRKSAVDFDALYGKGVIVCDYSIFLFAAMTGDIYYFKDPMAVYRYHPTSTWSTNAIGKQLQGSIEVLDSMTSAFSDAVNSRLRESRQSFVGHALAESLQDPDQFAALYRKYLSPDAEPHPEALDRYRAELLQRRQQTPGETPDIRGLMNKLYDRAYLMLRGKWMS